MTGTVNGGGAAAYALGQHVADKTNPHDVKADQIMMVNDDGTETNLQSVVRQMKDYVDEQASVSKAIDTVPTQYGTLIYTGSAQTVTLNGFDGSKMTVLTQSVESATNAGPYKVLIQPKPGYYWADNGRNEIREVPWEIKPQALTSDPALSSAATDLVYTGEAITPTWTGLNSAIMTCSGDTSATDAGPYAMVVTLDSNYCWKDGSTGTKSFPWAITPKPVEAVPTQSGTLTFTGSEQSPTWSGFDSDLMTVTGTQAAAGAGGYTVTFALVANRCWPDGSTDPKDVVWTINKAGCVASLSKTTMSLITGSLTDSIAVTRTGDGAITATSSNAAVATVSVSGNTVSVTGKAKGSATITVNVAEGTNHLAPASLSCSVTVTIVSTNPADNTPAEVQKMVQSGNAGLVWKPGDAFPATLSGTVAGTTISGQYQLVVLGFNHNSAREGNNTMHVMLGRNSSGKEIALCDGKYGTSGSDDGFRMNPGDNTNNYGGNAGGWRESYARSTLMSQCLNLLPSAWRNIVTFVNKWTDNGTGSHNTAAEVSGWRDIAFLLSEFEVFGACTYSNPAEKNYQQQYDYFKNGNSRVAYNHTNPSTAVGWWLRSPCAGYSANFCLVSGNGNPNSGNASASAGLRPAFKIG